MTANQLACAKKRATITGAPLRLLPAPCGRSRPRRAEAQLGSNALGCTDQCTGNGARSRGRFVPSGCRPSRTASTTSGARSVSRSRLPRKLDALLRPDRRKQLHQPRQPQRVRLPLIENCLDDVRRQQRGPQQRTEVTALIRSADAISLIEAYRPSSSSRRYRNARASAFTSAGSARVERAASPPSRTGVTTVVRPGRRRMVSGTRTVRW
jgi:hypothetical protein